MRRSWLRVAIPLAVWAGLLLVPAPSGLEPNAWSYFALFAAVIVALVLEPIPASAIGVIGLTIAIVTRNVFPEPGDSVKWGLSGFSNTTVWLIFGAFMLSMGYQKTGLGRRLALLLVKRMGRSTLGLGYAIAFADLLLAPGTPSNTARSAGAIYPIISNIPELFDCGPGPTARRIGSYIMWTAFATTAVTSSMFLTGLAPNPLAVSLVQQTAGIEITWVIWLRGILPVAAPLVLLLPLITYVLYPPDVRRSPEIPRWAARELASLGKVRRQELVMAGLVTLAIALWIFGGQWVSATTVVLVVISLMIVMRVVSWEDVVSNRAAWNVLVWFATLVALAGGLNRVGFVDWLASAVADQLTGLNTNIILAALVAFFFLIHYLFASLTAHTVAILPVILAVGKATPGMPMETLAPLLCYSLGMMGVLTPYATGPAPVYYTSGYISRGDFWRLGFIFGLIYLSALLLIGIPYLG